MIARVLCYLFGLLGVLCTGKPLVKTLIVGAGPGGLLSAHALLSRYKEGQHTYDDTVGANVSSSRGRLPFFDLLFILLSDLSSLFSPFSSPFSASLPFYLPSRFRSRFYRQS